MRLNDSGFTGALSGLNALELMADGDTFVHRLHPLAKLSATIAYVAAVISFGRYDIGPLLPYFFYPAILTPLSDTPCGTIARRLLPALPFPILGGLSNIFFDRAPMAMIGGITITGGMVSFAVIMIKTVLSVSAVLLLVSTTGVAELSRQLSAIGVPKVMVLQLTLTYRYLSVLMDEARRMFVGYVLRASGARGVRMKDMGAFVGVLLLRSIDRAERVYSAMKCRGFSGAYPVSCRLSLGASDLAYTVLICGGVILLRCF